LPKDQWVRTRVALGEPGRRFDWKAAFGREAPRVLDLGCGNGLYLVSSALRRPECDHLGIELVPPALRLASLRAGQRGLSHCKFTWGDASEFILTRCPPSSVSEVHLYHPQPYYDASKVDRRQLTPQTLLAIWRALAPGGLFVFQTDNPAYWKWARAAVPTLFEWLEHAGPWLDAPTGRTLREIRARQQGLEIFRAVATRLELDDALASARAAGLPEPAFDANKPGYEDRTRTQRPDG
jgi:tRNA (guanine-N7-)-methyltransferase